jgi:hypothetical protein
VPVAASVELRSMTSIDSALGTTVYGALRLDNYAKTAGDEDPFTETRSRLSVRRTLRRQSEVHRDEGEVVQLGWNAVAARRNAACLRAVTQEHL